MACIGNSIDTSHFNFLFGIKIELFMFIFSRFSDLAFLCAGHRKKPASSSYCNNPAFFIAFIRVI